MAADAQQALLLSDALDRVAAHPAASHLWIRLLQLMYETSEQGLFHEALAIIAQRMPSQGMAGFYRAATLDMLIRAPEFLPQACACLLDMPQADVDQCCEFFNHAWQRALLHSNDRLSFSARMQAIGLPQLALLIGRRLEQQTPAATPPAGARTRPQRVALVAPHLVSPLHPPTQMALNQVSVLRQQGVEVNLFSCQELDIPDARHLLGNGINLPPAPANLQTWLKNVEDSVRIHLGDVRFSVLRRWRGMLTHIQAYDPDVVLFVGLHSGLVQALYRRYPVVGLSTNSIAPLIPSDVWLTAQAALANTTSSPWHQDFPSSLAYYHPFRVPRKAAGEALPRATLNLPANAVLMITMGSHLNVKIEGAWAQRVCDAMTRHPHLIWLLVGGDGAMPPALAQLPPERLRMQAYTAQAEQWLATSDLYLHPPIMGGGFSVAEAMSLGLPVLALANADGGDKLGAAADADMAAYFARLDTLASDAGLRRSTGQRMREHFDSALDLAASGPSLLAACTAAMQRHQQRITASRA